MKKLGFLALGLLLLTCTNAQTMRTIELNAPNKSRGSSIMQSLSDRQSVREFADRDLAIQDLSDLLWAANGFNRPDKRTAASAMNTQSMDIYVCMKDGVYLYNAQDNRLEMVLAEDLRELAAGRPDDAVAEAPAILLLVEDSSKNPRAGTGGGFAAYDAGIISGNIYLFCSGCGLATVCRGSMDRDGLIGKLGFGESKYIHLNHPVGYAK